MEGESRMKKEINDILCYYPEEMPDEEVEQYVARAKDKYGRKVHGLNIELDKNDADFVKITYDVESVPFQRLRRITGYLVGTLDRWNDGKRAEERDRVKQDLIQTFYGLYGREKTEKSPVKSGAFLKKFCCVFAKMLHF